MHPEQLRALAYARRRGTEAPLADIRARILATYAELESIVETLPAELAVRRTAASGWSIHEVVDHLVLSDGPAVGQLRELLAGRDVDQPIPASLQSADPLAFDWSALRDRLRDIHREIAALLDGAADARAVTATAPVRMVVKCAGPDGVLAPVEWTERFDWKAFAILLHAHNREHIAQIQRILTRLHDERKE
jgi:hypothetical protein